MRKTLIAIAAASALGTTAAADEPVVYVAEDTFENVTFAVESAIVGAGLVIDYTSHVGEMLERTRADVGSDVVLYTNADVFVFCSATVSREVMEADLMNIQYCPYGIFVAERADTPGQVMVGYRNYPDGPMDKVEAMLDGIVKEALGQ